MPFLSAAERMFWDNVAWNTSLARSRSKSRRRVGFHIMTAEELLKRLEGLGLAMDRRTLNRYVKWQLVTAPEQRTGGKGVKADYPEEAVAEAAAAAELMKQERWRKEAVKQARALYLAFKITGIDFAEAEENGEIEIHWEAVKEHAEGVVGQPLVCAWRTKGWLATLRRYS